MILWSHILIKRFYGVALGSINDTRLDQWICSWPRNWVVGDDKYINRCIFRSHPVKFFVKKIHTLLVHKKLDGSALVICEKKKIQGTDLSTNTLDIITISCLQQKTKIDLSHFLCCMIYDFYSNRFKYLHPFSL